MMELDACKALWREGSASAPLKPLRKEELMTMIHARTADIRARAVERVHGESYTYVAIVIAITAMNLTTYGATLKTLASSLAVLAFLGGVVAALFYKQYQLRTLPLGDNLKESLIALLATLDSARRTYMAAYMACVVIGVVAVEGFLVWRHGLTLLLLISLALAAVFVVWCYRSGRVYVQRMFGHYRADVSDCLRELEAA